MFEELANRTPGIIDQEKYPQAAVLIPLIEHNDGFHVLFEVRSGTLKRQPGEICFPGGRIEAGETPCQAAIRETMEELKLESSQVEVLAPMDIYMPGFGQVIYPFLGLLTEYQGQFSKDEVQRIFEIPLAYFLEHEPDNYVNHVYTKMDEHFPVDKIPGGASYPWRVGKSEVSFYEIQGEIIWGMTARIMKSAAGILGEYLQDGRKESTLMCAGHQFPAGIGDKSRNSQGAM